MRFAVLMPLTVALLCGCAASPAPVFFGAARQEVMLEGYRFAVYLKEGRAEVVRLGYLPRAARDRVPALMVRAAETASGCRVRGPARGIWRSPSLPGDTGEARFELECRAAG
ncbi:hypothetical protein [Rhodobacter maris]|uniref:Lipoprotein n=1 Tax=Rhodobacter maris TaxID=446682 RepID=A0A285T612_9RHOB|nr:hypothetical protein [Rhodobacter maris]SOC16444.1 hypothetical protein SAMN05877831_11498 [Rhodobacter maris]